MRTSTTRRFIAAGIAGLTAAALVGFGSTAATAASAAATTGAQEAAGTEAQSGSGWIRVGHLSADTKTVDVKLSALAGGATVFELKNVAYGQVSPYTDLAAGTYVVSMVPAGSPTSTKAMISTNVTITQGEAATVAAYGPNTKLQTKVFVDDLTGPAEGSARIRLIQASTEVSSVDVSTSTGTPIAKRAATGTATGYASVPAGPWNLELTGGKQEASASVDLAPGTVSTLFVLDNASGGITLMPVLDSSAAGDAPTGPVETGGGGLAKQQERHDAAGAPEASAAGALSAAIRAVVTELRTAVS
ncbi:DUF4397 domain-containing protein [Plantibacter sp. YIM 135249]|uniref:DUF4397 domain-containing protein n=1 Tax=Plantibacter sp. YIM 135249 TaxID=3423918 RepID=UPI003D34A048